MLACVDAGDAGLPAAGNDHRRPATVTRAVIGALVTHVLVHEIGHHFGLSDADMEAIEAAADG